MIIHSIIGIYRWAVFHWIQIQTKWKGQHRKAHVQWDIYISKNTTNLWRLVQTVRADAPQKQIKLSVQCTCFHFPFNCQCPRVCWFKSKKIEKKLYTYLKQCPFSSTDINILHLVDLIFIFLFDPCVVNHATLHQICTRKWWKLI